MSKNFIYFRRTLQAFDSQKLTDSSLLGRTRTSGTGGRKDSEGNLLPNGLP